MAEGGGQGPSGGTAGRKMSGSQAQELLPSRVQGHGQSGEMTEEDSDSDCVW